MQNKYYIVIPAQVRLDKRLTPFDKLIYGEILALSKRDGFCWAQNRYLGDIYSVCPDTVSRSVKKLEKCGYIMVQFDGAGNALRRIYPEVLPPDSDVEPPDANVEPPDVEIGEPPTQMSKPPRRKCRTEHNKHSIKNDQCLFDRFWSAYPRKIAKQAAQKAFCKLKPDAALLSDMLSALGWQCESADWTRDGGKFIPYPATWLNGHRWEDDPPNKPEEPARPMQRCETYFDESGKRCARLVPEIRK